MSSFGYPRDLSQLLSIALEETFVNIGKKPIYKSDSKTVIARWSKKYNKTERAFAYWFGLKAPDLERINKFGITHFAYVCDEEGVVLVPTMIIQKRIKNDELLETKTKGALQHYHIQFDEESGAMMWILRTGFRKNVENYYHRFTNST